MTTTTPTFSRTDHQRRLRNAVKRLVIELVQRQALILGLPPLKRLVKPELQRWLTLILSVDRALGYLEPCLAAGLQDANLRAAASGFDSAIDCVNEHLASC